MQSKKLLKILPLIKGCFFSNLKRYTHGKLGKISSLSFENINIDGESGIFIYGGDISNIKFNKIKIKLKNKTEFEKNLYDLRPCDVEYEIKDKLHVIYAYKANNILFDNFSYEIDENFKKYLFGIYSLNEVDNFVIKDK